MRRPILAAAVATVALVPVLALRGQSTKDQPHGDLQLDCAECHNPERWVPVDKPPTFRHDADGVRPAVRPREGLLPQLPHDARLQPRGDLVRGLPQGRPPRRDGLPVRDVPHAHHLDEPARDVPGPQPDPLPALRVALPARLHGLPPEPAAVRVQEHPRRVRQLPPLDATSGRRAPTTSRRASRGAARTATSPRPRRGTARRSRTPPLSPSREGTPDSFAPAATAAARTPGSRPPARPATRRTTRPRRTRTTPPAASRPLARTATPSRAGGQRSSTTTRRASP